MCIIFLREIRIYDTETYLLKKFDEYCLEKHLDTTFISRDFLNDWMIRRGTEGITYQTKRISVVRGFLIYMITLGILAYIPHHFAKIEKHVPHILSADEIEAFFYSLDNYSPKKRYIRLANEYKLLFRIIYCCGLRNTEACTLKMENIDLSSGQITILKSKGDKDRLVFLSLDLRDACIEYKKYIKQELGFEPLWFFPSYDINKPLRNTTISNNFNKFWNKTKYAETCDKKPVVHGLRHTFVVRRMNLWMEQGIDIRTMLPYLSKHLGHKSINETFYYYHHVEEAFKIIREKDSWAELVIPEVDYEV